MAPRTRVEGNKVHVGEGGYTVSPAGKDQYVVHDDFGVKLGYFTVRGKTVTPEDYGVDGAPPIVQIGRLWAAANLFANPDKNAGPATKGVCRIAVHERPDAAAIDKARDYRAWMKKQTGCKASFFVHDPATGKAMSISIWETRAHVAALRDATPPGDAAPLPASSVEIYPIVEEP